MSLRALTWIPPPNGGGASMTVDHIVPIPRVGSNGLESIQPLCYSRNSRVGACEATRPTSNLAESDPSIS